MTTQWEAQDKVFLITGGASGLGAEYTKLFLEQGAKNIAVLDIAEDVGKTLVASLNEKYPGKAAFFKCDVSKEENIKTAFQQVLDAYKKIDVIINNAGIMNDSPNVWRISCDVNWQGVVSFTLKGLDHMRKDEGGAGGTIINISSVAAIFRIPHLPIYCGTKIAVLHFSQCLAMSPVMDKTGVRILTICFGPTDTPLMEDGLERSVDRKAAEIILAAIEPKFQKVGSAVSALLKMFKEGESGSIWYAINDKPVKDITLVVKRAFDEFENMWFSEST
ncbi:15-hydroxyprostaglandin dehydrogenase [NAD(+)]-like isoform X2 [Leptidea sinapis]|uniref:15-hydroxyprostaglandin dehydrogenase [NAD(+)]-like isoform X2 n=1 Tax=Leptidea sinapis TaxID=189913 RepID=UPI00213E6F92|nr:15-hydroxyprostaglandin dehydrogenase [NAD(+)]-like isoform X2 [Leptidea sinapis]